MADKKNKTKKKTKEQRPVVEIKGLRVKYDKVVLKKIDWKINRGEQWVLLGSNGSGKDDVTDVNGWIRDSDQGRSYCW